MANVNRFVGLARGPIDHKSSSVINMVSAGPIDMGAAVALSTTIIGDETLPRVGEISVQGSSLLYGIAVGGDIDGIYGDGSASVDDSTRATNAAGQGVVIVTQGRCLVKAFGGGGGGSPVPNAGIPLTQSATAGVLESASEGDDAVIAVSLFTGFMSSGDTDMIPVDVQRAKPLQ